MAMHDIKYLIQNDGRTIRAFKNIYLDNSFPFIPNSNTYTQVCVFIEF